MPGLGRATTLVMPSPHSGNRTSSDERQRFGDQFRVVEELPETVGRPGEMMPGLRGPDAGVDPDEQHAHAGPDRSVRRRSCQDGLEFFIPRGAAL